MESRDVNQSQLPCGGPSPSPWGPPHAESAESARDAAAQLCRPHLTGPYMLAVSSRRSRHTSAGFIMVFTIRLKYAGTLDV